MGRPCVFCSEVKTGMRHAKHSTCFSCLDEIIELHIDSKEA